MTNLHNEHDLHDLYGPLYKFSDHKRGDVIRYHTEGVLQQGTILWICGPGPIAPGTNPSPMRYIVENDYGGWPDVVYEHEVSNEE